MENNEETIKEIASFKEFSIKSGKEDLIRDGGIVMPHLLMLSRREGKFGVIMLALEGDMLNNENDKEYFAKRIMPGIRNQMRQDGHEIIALSFTTEAWVTSIDTTGKTPEEAQALYNDLEYRKAHRQEVMMTHFETMEGYSMTACRFERDEEEQVENDKGHMVSKVTIVEDPFKGISEATEATGRFTNLIGRGVDDSHASLDGIAEMSSSVISGEEDSFSSKDNENTRLV